MSWLSSLFGGGGGGSSGGGIWGNIFQAILGGVSGSADAKLGIEMAEKKAKIEGVEDRKTLDFTAQLNDYYNQLGKQRKNKVALDSYGQFSLMNRYAPNYTPSPGVQVPTKPTPPQ